MRGASGGAELEPQCAARREPEPAVGRLAVDKKPASVRGLVRHPRAVAASLLADHKQQSDARFARGPQRVGRRDLRGKNPFGVARPAPVEAIAVHTAREKRRHAVEMCREDNRG